MKNFKFHVAMVETKKNVLNQPIMEDSNGLTKSATVCGLYKKEILIFF